MAQFIWRDSKTALKVVDVTTFTTGDTAKVTGVGEYVYDSAGTGGDTETYIDATTGTGGWNLQEDTTLSSSSTSRSGSSLIGIPALTGATWTTQEHSNNLFASTGCTGDNYITDAGGGTVDVSAGSGFIKASNSDTAQLVSFDWAESLGISIPIDTTRYIGIEYNAGSPQVIVKTLPEWNNDTEFSLGTVVNDDGVLHIFDSPWQTTDALSHILERFVADQGHVSRDAELGGLIIGDSGDDNRNVTMTAGRLWSRFNKFAISAFDSSGIDTFSEAYRDGAGGWTYSNSASAWNNLNYDDGSGTLATINNNYYINLWWYLTLEGALIMLYGQEQYSNSATAEAEAPPSATPDYIYEGGILIGRFVIEQGSLQPVEVQSTFDGQSFTAAQAASHANLADIQGGTAGELYHLTAAELSALQAKKPLTLTATAANDFSAGSVGYISDAGTVTLADASTEATAKNVLLMATGSISGGASGTFARASDVTVTAHGFTLGVPLYLSETAGALTTTAPTTAGAIVRVVGYAVDANTIYLRDDSTYIEIQ